MVAQLTVLCKIRKLNVFIAIESDFEMAPNNGTLVYSCENVVILIKSLNEQVGMCMGMLMNDHFNIIE